MKLELEYIAPYLPFGLKVDSGGQMEELTTLDTNHDIQTSFRGHLINHTRLEFIKPILRPLSDLTKEIEHNGERFVPIDVIFKECGFTKTTNHFQEFTEDVRAGKTEYRAISRLFEWHFDVFELIEKGLAVNPSPSTKER